MAVSGGETSDTEGSGSYTNGQVTHMNYSSPDSSFFEGVQQPYEISMTTGLENKTIELAISVFPNPVKDHLTLKIKDLMVSSHCWHILAQAPNKINYRYETT